MGIDKAIAAIAARTVTGSIYEKGSQYRGAPMGRISRHKPDADTGQKFYLSRVRINSGGYDASGAYWGLGQPLFAYESADGEISDCIRASDRDSAKAKLVALFPGARFHR